MDGLLLQCGVYFCLGVYCGIETHTARSMLLLSRFSWSSHYEAFLSFSELLRSFTLLRTYSIHRQRWWTRNLCSRHACCCRTTNWRPCTSSWTSSQRYSLIHSLNYLLFFCCGGILCISIQSLSYCCFAYFCSCSLIYILYSFVTGGRELQWWFRCERMDSPVHESQWECAGAGGQNDLHENRYVISVSLFS